MGAERLRAVARGEVQGVGYRYAVRERARQLGLAGYALNRADGSVLVEAEGLPEALDLLEAFLERGPRYARVDNLGRERVPATGEFDGFVAK